MHESFLKKAGTLLLAGALALTGCSGDDGSVGPAGPAGGPGAPGDPGDPGQDGNDGMNGVGGELKLVIDGVATAAVSGTNTATLTFTVYPAAAVCPGGVCGDALSMLKQKTFYATKYDAATNTFPTDSSFSFGGFKFKGLVDGGKGAQYTATRANPSFTVETSQSAMVYGYIGNSLVLPQKGHYQLLDDVSSAGKVYGAIAYESDANVSGCETCHVAPYSKHGYRQAAVAGLPDMASCKACHTDQRVGSDQIFQMLADDPLAVTQLTYKDGDPEYSADQLKNYAYRATVMNDTHQSHAMEFAYPQSMANCVSCHAGKLDRILTDANFTLETCKSCHPVTGPAAGYVDAKRAPALKAIVTAATYHPTDLYTTTVACNGCHKTDGFAPTFATLHTGYNKAIYSDATAKLADAVKTQIGAVTYDSATKVLTVPFSLTGLDAQALVKPTVVVSLYGYDTKDFLVSGHGSQADGTKNLEWAEGATQRSDPTKSANSDRLGVLPLATAGNAEWTATANLTLWADLVASGAVKRVEIAVLPKVGLDQTIAVGATNPGIAVAGVSKTIDLVTGKVVVDAEAYGKAIVNPAKCNACHEALGTTFHDPSYGSAGVVGCRLCHVVDSGGSHLEMQSRSIDSYVHALHSFQVMDVKTVDFADPIDALRYKHHIESTYPNFSILNCESCHNPGTYNVPDQSRSLPSVLSASAATLIGWDRDIATVPSYVTGPGSRACGSCHRAEMINEDDAAGIASFNQHAAMFGTLVEGNFLDVTQTIMQQIVGGPTPAVTVSGAQVESCSICHPNAGAEHQAAFNRWSDGL